MDPDTPDSSSTRNIEDIVPESISLMALNIHAFGNENDIIHFTDCHEANLLRMVHILFVDFDNPRRVNIELLRKHCTDPGLIAFIEKYPEIFTNKEFRQTEIGKQIRLEWTLFLSCRPHFQYKIYRNYELAANLYNLMIFFHVFFKYETSEIPRLSPDDFIAPLCRPGYQFRCDDVITAREFKDATTVHQTTIVYLSLNGKSMFQWYLTEIFEDWVRITGHSEMVPCKNICTFIAQSGEEYVEEEDKAFRGGFDF